jgi:hypothetical protein
VNGFRIIIGQVLGYAEDHKRDPLGGGVVDSPPPINPQPVPVSGKW